MGRLADWFRHLVDLARTVHDEEIRYPAAALAYYGFVSFVPLLLLVFVLLGERLAGELGRAVPQFLTPSVQELVRRSLTTASGRTGAGALAALVLLWSGLNVVDDVRTVVERIEGPVQSSFRHWIRDATVILGALVLAILAVVTTTTLLGLPAAGPLLGLVGFAVLWVVLAVVFVPLYYVPSGMVGSPRRALPGAVVASFGWAALQTGIQFYATHAGRYAIYGTLSGVIILLTSLYIAAALLLIGIVVNAKVAARTDR
jgi:membrane protein